MSNSTHDIRAAFLSFFEHRQHQVTPSAPITPKDDPTLLFVNAGMAPLKDYFSGARTPPSRRMVSSQKCVRAGGKHNDLDNVGYTARHHTFFEMLGNFSFGDYFKPDAIEFAWNFLTGELGIDKNRLLATVYHTDDEAAELWRKIAGLPDERIIRIATDDNFWSMGDTGPCGPCSEIFYDHGDHVAGGPPGSPDEDGDRFVEIWNLVFMQFERFADGRQENLPAPCIDTGSGLERVAAVLQGVTSNFETDIFKTLITTSQNITGNRDPELAASHRVVADHIRTCAFLVAEGVMPSNEGRGYVLRRIMRRAMRHLNLLGADDIAFHKLVAPLVDTMGDHYQELRTEQARIEHALQTEEKQFRATLDRGMRLLERELDATATGAMFSGEVAFRLYDTYGFPLDLTQDVLRGQNMSVDVAAFDALMTEQRERARASWSGSGDAKGSQVWNELADTVPATKFTGYDKLTDTGTVRAIVVDGAAQSSAAAGTQVAVVFDRSPFYAESGGQVGDQGQASGAGVGLTITDTQKPAGGLHAHIGVVAEGELRIGAQLTLSVNADTRRGAAAHHSATHLMHAALREVLGDHVGQKGSYVGPDRLRFDFSHPSAVTVDELRQIEAIVNSQVALNRATDVRLMELEDALATGAMAMFDERYDDQVRVLSMGGAAREDGMRLFAVLHQAFVEKDMSLLEVNPLIVMKDGRLRVLDAKVSFDGNALFRHPDIMELRDETEEDEKEIEASRHDLAYVALDGDIGCMVNGAGLAMATMDIIKLYGAEPANFLDVGGGASKEKVTAAFKIITADPNVKGILVNIFGGIMRCDVIAEGVVAAVKEVGLQVPLVVRLEGTNVQKGKDIINQSGLNVIAADDLDDAAQKIVAAVKG